MIPVKTISETRLDRLNILVKRHSNSLAELNEALGLSRADATLSQIRTKAPHSKTGKPRSMGDDLARKIENALGLPLGWMDTPLSYAELAGEDESQKAKLYAVMENIPADQYAMAIRLLDALAEQPTQKTGTSGE